jgi:hypothetical protein
VNFLPKALSFAFPPQWRLGAEIRGRMWARGKGAWCVLVGILLLTLPSAAQLEVGDTALSLSGDIGFNYNGTMNQGASGHNLGLSGDGNLVGSYYNPNFLNFNVRPFYDRAQSNSVFGAVTNSSGVSSGLNLFSGSHFPGSFSYNKVVNGTGVFGVPGSSVGLASNGNNQGFAVNWSELLPDWPTLMATYAISSSSESIYGTQQESKQTDHDFLLQSTYKLAGFRIAGGYNHRNVNGTFSELLEGIPAPVNTDTSTNNYQVNASHSFPMSGAFSVSYSRTGYDYGFHDGSSAASSGASDTLNGNLNFRPITKLSVGFNAAYNDSLLGGLPGQITTAGTSVRAGSPGTFRSFLVGSDANYQLRTNLGIHVTVNHSQQVFLGQSYGATQFAGSVNYLLQHSLLKGLSFSVGAVDSATKEGNTGLGFVGNLNYNRKFSGWDVDTNFSYSQNVQTLVLVYTSSSMGWVANLRRRVGTRSYFMAGYGGSHSGLTAVAGSSSSAQRVSSSFTYRRYSANAFYSTSTGTAAFTPTGLVALPPNVPPSALPPGSVIVFDSKAYGFNASASPLRRLIVSAGYAQSKGDTIDPLLHTFTTTNLINGVAQYKLRKIYVNAGYTHLRQSVGAASTSPVTVTSYYIGISRWFNFF